MAEAAQPERTELAERTAELNRATTREADEAFDSGFRAGPRQLLWEPAARFASALPRVGFQAAVLEGYSRLLCGAKLWEAEQNWRRELATVEAVGRERWVVAKGCKADFERLRQGGLGRPDIAGGRGGARRFAGSDGPWIVRELRRGGAVRWMGRRYLGWRHRPIEEFWMLLAARERGLPVPAPTAAWVETTGPSWRGWIAMREIEAARSFWEALRSGRVGERCELVGDALCRLFDGGLEHVDLNLGNILLVGGEAGAAEAVHFIDLDRARLHPGALPQALRDRGMARLRRSARKFDPQSTVLADADLDRLEARCHP